MVWKASTSFGIARAFSPNPQEKCVYVVARYKPKGNIKMQVMSNVEKGAFSPSVCRLEGTTVTTGNGAQLVDGCKWSSYTNVTLV